MNELQEIWEQEEQDGDLLQQILHKKSFINSKVQGPLAKLKRNLNLQIWYALIITLAYALLIFYFPYWQVQGCLLLLIGFNLWAVAKAFSLYKSIDLDITKFNVLNELKKQYHAFTEWQRQNLRVALFVYPFAAAGGFMLGGTLGSGKTPTLFMNDSKVLIALIITIIILVPLSYLLAKWMTKVAFGKYIIQLKNMIDELEKED